MPNKNWKNLNHLQIGSYAEYLLKMELTSYGMDVYTSEVDDHGVDFIFVSNDKEFYKVQVKSARLDRSSYIFASKDKFNIEDSSLIMALVLFEEDKLPNVYLIPSNAWQSETELFRNRKYDQLKSKPEWGLNISKKNIELLKPYSIENHPLIAKVRLGRMK